MNDIDITRLRDSNKSANSKKWLVTSMAFLLGSLATCLIGVIHSIFYS